MPADEANKLVTSAHETDDVRTITAEGVLDTTTYLPLRDRIIKAALDGARAVIVDVTDLAVPTPSAWAVFTSARWHVGDWPDVPIALVCAHERGRSEIARNGVTRYVPVYETIQGAVAALSGQRSIAYRRRARADLPHAVPSIAASREFVSDWLTTWSQPELIPVAKLVVTALMENALAHTQSAPGLRIEGKDDVVAIAVEDQCVDAAVRHERSTRGADDVSGLAIVAAMSRAWGNSPMPTGKAVWALIGPENRL